MKELTYIPFGAQYYRAPTPGPENWERDLTALRSQGFNTVKLWVQWRWNMPKRETYDFSDIDRLMELCGGLGLRVILNIICDVAPAWFYRDYPDSLMVAADGRRLYPRNHRLSADRRCARPLLPSSGGGGDTPAVHRGGGQTVRRPSRPPLLGSLERAGADLRHMAGSQSGKHGLLLRAFGGAVYSVAETEVRQPGGPQPPLGQELPGVGGNRTAPLRRHLQRYGGLAGVLRGNPGGGTAYAGQGGASPRWRTQRHGSHRPHALFQLYEHRQRGISAGPGDGLVRQQRGKYALPGGDRHHRRQEQMGAQRGDSRRGGQHHGPAGDPFP